MLEEQPGGAAFGGTGAGPAGCALGRSTPIQANESMENNAMDPVEHAGSPKELYEDSLVLLASVRRTVAELLEDVGPGQTRAVAALPAEIAALQKALKSAIDLERAYHEWKGKPDDGGGAVAAIDMDRARHDIGCRLDRLRACCRSG